MDKQTVKSLAIVAAVLIVISIVFSFFVPKGADRCERMLLGGLKDECYLSMAREANDSAYCGNIDNNSTRDICFTMFGGEPGTNTDCEKLTNTMVRDQCLASLAQSTSNVSQCARLSATTQRDNCYSAYASAKDDASACRNITADYLRISCSNNIYLKLAIARRNPAYCSQLIHNDSGTLLTLVDSCIYQVATQSNDTSLCGSLRDPVMQAQCRSGGADINACELITNPDQRSPCIYSVAVNSRNPDYCDRVPTPYLRDNCFYQIATETRNREICDRIIGENMRLLCTGS